MRITVENQDESGVIRMSVETGGPLFLPEDVKRYAKSLSESMIHMIKIEMDGDDPHEPSGFFVPSN